RASPARTQLLSRTVLARCVCETSAPLEPLRSIRRLSRDRIRSADRIYAVLRAPASSRGEAGLRSHPGSLLPALGISSSARYTDRAHGSTSESRSRVLSTTDHFCS